MPNGSEEASVARATTLQGHMMPVGADASTEQGFRDWVGSVHPVFVETKPADLLIEMGYDRVAAVASVDEDMLRESFGVKRDHATLFVLAARALHRSLGIRTSAEVESVTTTTHAMNATKRRTLAPKVPLAGSTSRQYVSNCREVNPRKARCLKVSLWILNTRSAKQDKIDWQQRHARLKQSSAASKNAFATI